MAFNRSATTQAIACILSDEPMTSHDLKVALNVSTGAIQNSVTTLLHAGECREVQVSGSKGRMVRAFVLPAPPVPPHVPAPRGEYRGEPLPLRYVPREKPYISMETRREA